MSNSVFNTLVEPLKPGDKVGFFTVVEQIAAGGMGIIWKAHDSVMNRHVVIKQLSVQLSDNDKFRERFRREADIQKKVTEGHPYLVQIIDFIEDARGYFIVMEYVAGTTLERVLAKATEPVDILQTLEIIRDVAQGLQSMHDAGVIHRDLKPSNILIGANRTVKVCDFGLATMLAEQDTLEMGTARYMAPELFTGNAVDARADIYSLGMIVYEMLCGRPKFNEQFKAVTRDQRNEPMRWMKWHSNTKLKAHPLPGINEFVPEVLDEMVQRMMAKDPSLRIPSGNAVIEIIKRNFSKGAAQQTPAPGTGTSTPPPPPTQASGTAQAPPPPPPQTGQAPVPPTQQPAPGQPSQVQVASNPAAPPPTQQATVPGAAGMNADPAGMETAPLPKKGKWVLIAASVILLASIGIGGYFGYQAYQEKQIRDKRVQLAESDYQSAIKLMEDKQFAQAKTAFDQLASAWPGHQKYNHAATVRSILSQVRLDMAEANEILNNQEYEKAIDAYKAIADKLERASQINTDKLNYQMAGMISDIDSQNSKRLNFVENITPLRKLIAAGDFEKARIELRMLDRKRELYTEDEKQILATLRQENENMAIQGEISSILANSQDAVQANNLREGLTILQEGFEKYPSSAPLRDRISVVEKMIRYDDAITQADTAEQNGNLTEAIEAYERAQLIESKPAIADKIKTLNARKLNAEARQLQLAGDKDAAMQKYLESLGYRETDEAKEAVAMIKASDRRNAMIAQGRSAMNGGNYDQAIQHFQSALELGRDDETELMLNVSKVRLEIAKAKQLLNEGKLIEAGKRVDAALAIDPNDETAKKLGENILLAAKYKTMIQEADDMRKRLKFRQAGRAYREAKKMIEGSFISTEEVDQRIKDNEYESILFKTKEAIEILNWRAAKANYAVLKKLNNTKEVQEIGKYLEEHAPKD